MSEISARYSESPSGFADFMDRMARKARPYVAFTALNAVWRSLDKDAGSILDAGCGKGEPMKFINRSKRFYAVGLDIFKPYLEDCKRHGIHDDYVLCDVRRVPLREESFDVILCIEVLEHLKREHGKRLIRSLEQMARKQVIITTPVGVYKQQAYEENPHQEHKWIWSPTELKRFGYGVKGVGIRNMGGEEGLASRLPKIARPLFHITWILTGLLTYFYPTLAGHMVCIKNLRQARIQR